MLRLNGKFSFNATVAQSVEQLIRNQQVSGSSPISSSKNSHTQIGVGVFLFIKSGLELGASKLVCAFAKGEKTVL